MTDTLASLLIVDAHRESAWLLAREAEARGYRVAAVDSAAAALGRVAIEEFDAIVVDVALAGTGGEHAVSDLLLAAPHADVVAMSDGGDGGLWSEGDSLGIVRKSDVGQILAAVERAVEARQIAAHNQRLVWELQTINDIAACLSLSLDLDAVLAGSVSRLVEAMGATGGSIRLRDEATGGYEVRGAVGVSFAQQLACCPGLQRPSDGVIASGVAVVVEDFADGVPDGSRAALPLRSAISVPMFAGTQLLGTISVGSAAPRRFHLADRRFLATIAAQIGAAIQAAQLHQSIRRAKREWEATIDAISDPIAVFNASGGLLRGNRALARHLGIPVTALRQVTCRQVGFCGGDAEGHDCRVTGAVDASVDQQEIRDEVTLPDGRIFSVTTFRVGTQGQGPSVVQVAKDVTEELRAARRLREMSEELAGTNARLVAAMDQLKSTQAQLVQAEKLSAIGHLVAGVAHELNNPLTSVIGYAQLLEEDLREGATPRPQHELAEDLQRISEGSERAARIVRNLLAFARRRGVSRAPEDMADVCARVLALRQYELRMQGIELLTDIPFPLPQLLGDAGQMQQLLLNLILNAEQAMRDAKVKRLSIAVRHDPGAGGVELTVADTGHGIEPANLSRVFDPFFTTREVGEGTGLGLSICYGIVRDHGGHIHVESTPGAGTTFRVLLPARLAGAAVRETRVLVAHPEQGEREFIAAALGGWGYDVVTSALGEEALELYRGPIHVAILDRALAAADLDAWQRARGADRRGVPLVLTSMVGSDRALEQLAGREGMAVLAPPVHIRALHVAMRAQAKECV